MSASTPIFIGSQSPEKFKKKPTYTVSTPNCKDVISDTSSKNYRDSIINAGLYLIYIIVSFVV